MKSITIIGGGVAGLSLGILLRQRGVSVTLFEAGIYPRHRVCGEFISGPGQYLLYTLLPEAVLGRIARPAKTARFHLAGKSSPERDLPNSAVCISRYDLDQALADKFVSLGGDLQGGKRMTVAQSAEGFVHATGRRTDPGASEEKWIGLKVHARNVELSADLEMFGVKDGYVGICRIRDETVNVCGLFRNTAAVRSFAKSPQALLLGKTGSQLAERMKSARLLPGTFCSVSGMHYKKHRLPDCVSIGDALGLIPPITGNGMSLAMETAALASARILDYCRDQCSWEELCLATADDVERSFGKRLAWGRVVHRCLLSPLMRGMPAELLLRSSSMWHLLFARTREIRDPGQSRISIDHTVDS